MRSITAVELGADICALARTSVRRGEVRLTVVELLDPAAFSGIEAFTLAVRQTRRSLRLPRRCRAVVWGLPEGAHRRDATVKPLIEPLTAAGFRVERVVSPCNALAALARLKTLRGEGSTCWLAINRGGVAIVVVRPGTQLYAHSFAWDSSVGSSGSQARLLQRYSLVSFLAPEVKRAMAEARKVGAPVDAVVTCGNLPDLRSLTMPLIEELDVEVETLDSLEGLIVKPQEAEKLAEFAPAIRLACAAAIARGTRSWDESKRSSRSQRTGVYVRAAGLAAAVAGIGYLWYMKPATTKPSAPLSAGVPAATPKANPPVASAPAATAKSNPPAVGAPMAVPQSNPPGVSAPLAAPKANPLGLSLPPAAVPKSTPPAVSVAAKKPESNPPAVSVPPKKSEANPALVTAPPPASTVTAPGARPGPPGNDPRSSVLDPRLAARPAVSVPAQKPESNPPAVSARAAVPKSNPPAVSARAAVPKSNPPAVSVPPKRSESNPPAVSVPPKRSESNPPKPAPVNATNAIPNARMQPLVTMPLPNTPAPRAPASASTVASAPPPVLTASAPQPRPNPPAGSVPAPSNRPALTQPGAAADKPSAGSTSVSSAPAAPRGPMPALLKDAVPRVTAILVARDRRFASIDGGQIIAIGDLVGRRTVVRMDEQSVVLQEPSGVQIRIGLGGRLLGVERAAR